jgi:hypothetical protein
LPIPQQIKDHEADFRDRTCSRRFPAYAIQQAIGAQLVNHAALVLTLAIGMLTKPQPANFTQAATVDRKPCVLQGIQEFLRELVRQMTGGFLVVSSGLPARQAAGD